MIGTESCMKALRVNIVLYASLRINNPSVYGTANMLQEMPNPEANISAGCSTRIESVLMTYTQCTYIQ